MATPRIRRRGGLVPRLIFALATTFLLVEGGLRVVLGNGAQGLVVQPSRFTDVCFELRPDSIVVYTGDAVRAPSSVIHVNRLGARGEERTAGAAGAAPLRVVMLGDALGFGQGVEDDETIPAAVARELTRRGYRTDVMNLAVPGSSPSRSVALLEHRAAALQPDLAVLLVSPDDLDSAEIDCPHQGLKPSSGSLSAGVARAQLEELLTRRLFLARALDLVQEVGWDGLLDRRGPYAPGRAKHAARPTPTAHRAEGSERAEGSLHGIDSMGSGPTFAAALGPRELWGDVPILLPSATGVPPIAPRNRAEHTFIAALERLADLGAQGEFLVAVAVLPDRATFRAATRCAECRSPQELIPGATVRSVDLAATWAQLVREQAVFFQAGEGLPSAAGSEELGRTLAAELAAWRPLREQRE